MNRKIYCFLQLCHEQLCSVRLQQAGHIFYADDVRARILEALCKVEIVMKIILFTLAVDDITGIADGCFGQPACALAHCFNANEHAVYPVKRIEYPEDVHSIFPRALDELLYQVVRISRIAYRIRAANEHLQK